MLSCGLPSRAARRIRIDCMSSELTINFDDAADKARLWNHFRPLKGHHSISICAYRSRRSDRQNRYYWPCFVKPFADHLRENNIEYDGRVPTDDEAHAILKFKFLPPIEVVDKGTGEVWQVHGDTTTSLTTTQFNEYLDRCAAFLVEQFGFIVPEPGDYHEREESTEEMELVV